MVISEDELFGRFTPPTPHNLITGIEHRDGNQAISYRLRVRTAHTRPPHIAMPPYLPHYWYRGQELPVSSGFVIVAKK